MHVVIGGAGQVGRHLAEFLLKDGVDVVLIDRDHTVCDQVGGLDCLVITGNAASAEVLADAGVRKADVFYAVTSHDEVNLAAAAIAKSHGAKRVVARINSLDLINEPESRAFRPIGVDVAISPDLVAATKITRLIEFPGILEIGAFQSSGLRLVEAGVEAGSPASGRKLAEVALPKGCNLVAIFRGAEVIIPQGSDVVQRGDHVVLLLEHAGLMAYIAEVFGSQTRIQENMRHARTVVVTGTTGLARRVATMLKSAGRRVSLVADMDSHDEVEALAAEMEGILVIEGSGRDVDVFREEGLDAADVVVAASDHDEFNLITCMLARSMGVPRTAAMVDQPELEELAERLGVGVAVSPRFTAVSTMLKYASDLEPEELTLLHHGEAQVLVVEVERGNRVADTRLRDAKLPRGAVVGAMIRKGAAIVPRGDEMVQVGDSLVIFAKASAVPSLSNLF